MKATTRNNDEIAERIKSVRSELSDNQKDFASKLGVGFSTFQKYEMGMSIPGGEAIRGFVKLGINANWLLTGEGEMLLSDSQTSSSAIRVTEPATGYMVDKSPFMPPIPHPGFVFVPRFEVAASMGNGSVIHSEQIVDYLAFREDWVRKELGANPNNLILISSVGDSMEPTLKTNDLLLIDRGLADVRHDAIYAFALNGELRVKRMQFKMNGTMVVRSDNPQYEPEVISATDTDTLRIIGRVVWFGRGM